MASEKTQSGRKQVAIGLTWAGVSGRGQAVVVRRDGQQVRVLEARAITSAEQWKDLLRQYGSDKSVRPAVCAGLASSQVGFYNFDVPPVSAEQLGLVVRSQAESCLPLPLSRMRFTWRAEARGPNRHCIVAAVRRDALDPLQAALHGGDLQAVIPDVQALIDGRHRLFESGDEPSIVLGADEHEAVAVLAAGRTIRHVLRVDIDPDPTAAGLWMNDIMQAIRTEQTLEPSAPICLMDLGSRHTGILQAQLEREGFAVTRSTPDAEKLERLGLDGSAAGHPKEAALALLALDEAPSEFDFLQPESTDETELPGSRGFNWSRLAVHLLAGIAVLLVGMYWKDRTELKNLEQYLLQSQEGQNAAGLLSRQEYRRQVARVRPDLLDLLTLLQKAEPEGVFLDSLLFELGKPVEVKGQADSYEKVYEFHKNLTGESGISQPRLIEPSMDEKTRKVKFTVRFDYRHFSK